MTKLTTNLPRVCGCRAWTCLSAIRSIMGCNALKPVASFFFVSQTCIIQHPKHSPSHLLKRTHQKSLPKQWPVFPKLRWINLHCSSKIKQRHKMLFLRCVRWLVASFYRQTITLLSTRGPSSTQIDA